MSSYFQFERLAAPTRGETAALGWSPLLPYVAVSSAGVVSVYSEEGERIEEFQIRRNCDATAVAWHPTLKHLAIGWKDGAVSYWTDRQSEDTSVHTSPILAICWSSDGTRLSTVDQSGKFAIWDGTQKRLSLKNQYQKTGAMTHCIFRSKPQGGDAAAGEAASPVFLFGGEQGVVYLADEKGSCAEAFSLGSPLAALLYHEEKEQVVAITKNLYLAHFRIVDNKCNQIQKFKLNAAAEGSSIMGTCWAGPGVLAVATNESVVRLFNLEAEEAFALSLADPGHVVKVSTDRVQSLSYNPRKGVMAGGTRDGRVVMWRNTGDDSTGGEDQSLKWEAMPCTDLGSQSSVKDVQWGPGDLTLAAALSDQVLMLNEGTLYRRFRSRTAAMQVGSDKVLVERLGGKAALLKPSMRIGGLDLTARHIAVWNNKKIEVYELREGQASNLQVIAKACQAVAIESERLFMAVGSRIEICNFQGSVTQSISFSDLEGDPTHLDISGSPSSASSTSPTATIPQVFLAAATKNGFIKVWNVSRKEPKQIYARRFTEGDKPLGTIASIKINCAGNRVSILALATSASGIRRPDSRLFVYEGETDSFETFEFGPKRYPTTHFWDPTETKLLGCETRKLRGKGAQTDGLPEPEIEIATLFASPDFGLRKQDSFALAKELDTLIGVQVPYLYFMTKGTSDDGGATSRLGFRVLRDFIGMENADDTTRDALLNFSYQLTCGNMDEAYKSVKTIDNAAVWENMAKMCVKTMRLDVAEVCLGNMGHARGARAVREAKSEPELEARVAMVAIQLGLLEDAEKLYAECKRYDLLNRMYQASGQWEKAVQLAEKHDRIHLRTTHYNFAKYLESIGETAKAIKEYQISENHRYEVPRMLFDMQLVDELERYCTSSDDKELIKWWAQYCESNVSFDQALHFYQKAKDYLSLVRVFCFRKDFAKAAEIVKETSNSAAAYHLARQLENHNQIREAIEYFSLAGRHNHAVRLCKENGMDGEILRLALESGNQRLMTESGRYFEEKGVYEKAVLLYQKGGNVPRALDLAFRSQLFDSLRSLADDLGAETDPEMLARCANYFLEHGQFEKAAHLFVSSGQAEKALALCESHNVKITEDMAEKMTPPKPEGEGDSAYRTAILMKIAKCCKRQGSFHLACKKYTQAGNRIKAMKCLLKSADTEKIIFFAGVSRQKEIYILAANYLQTLDWHNDPEIMKSIINFYSKAHSWDSLASFYDACAQVEIDEYRDYEKARDALKEAHKYLSKGKGVDDRLAGLQHRINMVEKFCQARKLVKSDPQEMQRICSSLLEQPDIELALRVGDVFALLIEFYAGQQDYPNAYQLIERMRDRKIILSPYLDAEMVNEIHRAVGVAPVAEEPSGRQDDGEIDEEIGD
eukprot:tig00001107_g7093.t1